MTIEYCKNCDSDVFTTQIYCDTDSYIWECKSCKNRTTIQYISDNICKKHNEKLVENWDDGNDHPCLVCNSCIDEFNKKVRTT